MVYSVELVGFLEKLKVEGTSFILWFSNLKEIRQLKQANPQADIN